MAQRILLVIPSYNNRATLREMVEQSLRTGLDVLVVNDGSTDGALETIDDLPVHRIDQRRNRGKGRAIRAAAVWARERRYTHLITLDADGQHEPAQAARLVAAIRRWPSALVLGRRHFDEDAPGSSRFGRAFSNTWVRLCSGVSVADSQTGFRAYPVALLARVPCRGKRYEFEVEVVVRAIRAGFPVRHVDVSVHYKDAATHSHFRTFMDNARISKTFAGLFLRHLLPWPYRRLVNADPLMTDLSLRHPLRSLHAIHRRVWRRLEDNDKKLSLRHPIQSLRLLHLEKTTPLELAASVFLGIFLGAVPLIGFHTPPIIYYALRFGLNAPLAFYASTLCAVFLPPFVPVLCIEVGHWMLNGEWLTIEDVNTKAEALRVIAHEAHLRLLDYLVGSLVVGPLYGALVAGPTWLIATLRRKARYQSILRKRRARREKCGE